MRSLSRHQLQMYACNTSNHWSVFNKDWARGRAVSISNTPGQSHCSLSTTRVAAPRAPKGRSLLVLDLPGPGPRFLTAGAHLSATGPINVQGIARYQGFLPVSMRSKSFALLLSHWGCISICVQRKVEALGFLLLTFQIASLQGGVKGEVGWLYVKSKFSHVL